ncbi:hypothetical protein [Haliscomenobacter sp.]|uniref:CIS tube protein n=1 Tax=Haliscomenobacter sp. TaxID=2717303 RepID=UPI003BAA4E31
MSLRKIVLIAFGDETLARSELGRFTIPINPESYTRKHQIHLENSQNPGSQSNNARHGSTPVEELRLEFIFDNTNTIEGNLLNGTEVSKQVEDFLKLTYKLNGDIRRPNFLKIIWANDFVFDCQLAEASVNYTLFKPDGTPLRAKISATFKEHKAPFIRVQEEGKVSELGNAVATVSQNGERVANVTQKAYTAANSLLQVAKANDLVNFRKTLNEASQLVLPAINQAQNALQGGVAQVQNAANQARNAAQNAANTAQNAVNQAKIAAQNASGAVQNTANQVKNAAQNAAQTAQNAANSAKNAAEQAKNAAQNARNTAQNTAQTARNVANQVKNLF